MTFITPTVRVNTYNLHDSLNGVYVENLSIESSTPQKLDIFTVVKSDLHKIVGGWLDLKVITISGAIEASDETLLIPKLDLLKKALVDIDMTLFVSDGTNHRIWTVALDGSVTIERDKMYCLAKWEIKLIVSNPPYGIEANSSGLAITNTQSFSLLSIQNVFNVVFDGSAKPLPKMQFTIAASGVTDLLGAELLNRETGQSLSISFVGLTPVNGDVLIVDVARREVLFRGRSIAYDGIIPAFELGTNEIEVLFVTSNSNIQLARQSVVNDFEILREGVRTAQQFTPGSGQNMSFISVALQKIGNPTGNVRIGVMADAAGDPSGTYLGSSVTIPMTSIRTTSRWFTISIAGAGITAGTPIWIVADTVSSTANQVQHVKIAKSRQDQGFGALESWNGSAWVAAIGDIAFRAYGSNSTAQNTTVDITQIDEPFDTTARRDAANNQASWETGNSRVSMFGAPATNLTTVTLSSVDEFLTGANQHFSLSTSFVAAKTGTLNSVKVRMRRGATTEATAIKMDLRTNNVSTLGTLIATASNSFNQSALTTGYVQYTYTFSSPSLVFGTTYQIELWFEGNASNLVEIRGGTESGNYLKKINGNTGNFNSGGDNLTLDREISIAWTSYAANENAVVNQLNANNADIVSTSQLIAAVLPVGSTFNGQISADNGTNYQNIVRDTTPFQTETVPTVISAQLKWRGQLASSTPGIFAERPIIEYLQIFWRDGISLDATTKRASQSFTPTATGSISSVRLSLLRLGSPGNVTVRIETDSAGSPSGTLVNANATGTVTSASLSIVGFTFFSISFAGGFTLTAGVTYHIVAIPLATANNTNKIVLQANFNRYAGYEMRRSTNSGTTYTGFTSALSGYDLLFGVYGSGGSNFTSNLEVTYNKLWL